MDKEQIKKPEGDKVQKQKPTVKRRTLLKALAGVPVLGVFGFELAEKKAYDLEKKNRVLEELGLQNIEAPAILKSS